MWPNSLLLNTKDYHHCVDYPDLLSLAPCWFFMGQLHFKQISSFTEKLGKLEKKNIDSFIPDWPRDIISYLWNIQI